jgi:hypothetical protein
MQESATCRQFVVIDDFGNVHRECGAWCLRGMGAYGYHCGGVLSLMCALVVSV